MMIDEKIKKFLIISLKYYGKEIVLSSNQHYSINQIIDESINNNETKYSIQYGFPQSGCISMIFSYKKEENQIIINKVTVYAPEKDKELLMATFSPQFNDGAFNVKTNIGLDMDTKEYSNPEDIEQNPNALKILDIAISDLEQAQIIGECRVAVPEGNTLIPVCTSKNINHEKEKSL